MLGQHVRKFHRGFETLHLHMWRFSSISSERRAFQGKLRELQLQTSDAPMQPFTNPNGPGSLVDVLDGVSINARRLSLR